MWRSSCALFSVLIVPHTVDAVPKFQLGACYGWDNQLGAMDFAAKIALEEKFFDDILPTSDFEIEITSVDAKCRSSTAAKESLHMFLGRGQQSGRIYSDTEDLPPVIAINGCVCSSVTKVVANQGVPFGVPVVSGSSTSPDLSNKDMYPYFSRTVPPDNMQGRGLATLAYENGWRRLFGIHFEGDSYGEGVIVEFCEASKSLGMECIIKKLPFLLVQTTSDLPFDYDRALAAAKAIAAETPQPRILTLAPSQASWVLHVMHAAGLVGPKYQWMLSEIACSIFGVTDSPLADLQEFAAHEPDNPLWDSSSAEGSVWERMPSLMKGMMCLLPEDRGPRLESSAFTSFWDGITLDRLEAAGYPRHPLWDDSWLPIENWVPPYQALHFDGMTTLLVAISNMLARGVAPEEVKGEALNSEIFATRFEGLTGDIAFDDSGDRLAPYRVYNMRAPGFDFGSESSPNPHLVQVAVFHGASSTISFTASTPILYADGTATPPKDKPDPCQPGTEFSAAENGCVDCPVGKENRYSDDVVIGARCLPCAAGTFANTTGMSECVSAEAGYFVKQDGATEQEPCAPSTFTASPGQSECMACAPGRYGSEVAMTECIPATEGHYVNQSGSKVQTPCPEGFFGEFQEMVTCDRCAAGTYNSITGQTACPRCELGEYSSRGAAACTSCTSLGESLITKYQGSTSEQDCVCPEDTYRDVADRSSCVRCPKGLSCEEGSDLRNFELFKSGRQANMTSGGTYPKLLPNYWSSVDDPVTVFTCANEDRCPGGSPGTCAPNTEGIACARCVKEHFATAEQCEKCADIEMSTVMFPILPLICGPIVISILYFTFRDGPEKWGSWRNGLASVAFLTLNHYQMVSLGSSMDLQLPVDIQDTWKVWTMSGDVLSIFKLDCAGYGSFQAGVILRSIGPLIFLALVLLTYGVSVAVGRAFKPELAMQGDFLCNVYMSLIYTFFTGIASMSLSLFKCTGNPSGPDTLMSDRSVLCYQSEWNSMVIVSAFAVAVYCGGCFVLFSYIIWVAPKEFHRQTFQRRWKFLFIKYRADVHWWGLAILAKSMSINMGPIVVDDAPGQIYWMVFSSALYVIGIAVFFPWRAHPATILDVVMHMSVIIMLMTLSWFAEGDVDLDRGMTKLTVTMSFLPLVASMWATATIIGPAIIKRTNPELHCAQQQKVQEDIHKVAKILSVLDTVEIQKLYQALQEHDQRILMKASDCIQSEVLGRSSSKLILGSNHHLGEKATQSLALSTAKMMEEKDVQTEICEVSDDQCAFNEVGDVEFHAEHTSLSLKSFCIDLCSESHWQVSPDNGMVAHKN